MSARLLTTVPVHELRPLLEEESEHWLRELHWDFSEVSSAVANGIARGSLSGRVAWEAGRPVAYAYAMADGNRTVVGSVFATFARRGAGLEEELLRQVLLEAQADPARQRVECQTLFTTASGADGSFEAAGFSGRPRHYLVCELDEPLQAPTGPEVVRAIGRSDLPLVARLIHRSHEGSLDAALNQTYATPAHCQAFVETLVLRSGCGRFAAEASFIAERDGVPIGVILASQLSAASGHICQVSVSQSAQGNGLGSRLLRRSLEALRRRGMRMASLSVTVGNARAYALYRGFGFRLHRAFSAFAWVPPPGRVELPS